MSISIFETLCNELDDVKRRAGILSIISDGARQRAEALLSDKDTIFDSVSDKKWSITSITYKNSQGKLIVTSKGIDRIDDFGTMWSLETVDL